MAVKRIGPRALHDRALDVTRNDDAFDGGARDVTVDDVETWVPLDSMAVRDMRRRVLEVLSAAHADSGTVADAAVCVDRLVTNVASRAATHAVGLCITASAATVRIAVSEHLALAATAPAARQLAAVLAEALAGVTGTWGVVRDGRACMAWFELSLHRAERVDPFGDPGPAGSAPSTDTMLDRREMRLRPAPHPATDLHPLRDGDGAPSARLLREGLAGRRPGERDLDGDVLVSGDVRVNLVVRSVTIAGREDHVQLTGREFELLVHLVRHSGHVQSRPDLLRDVWGITFAADTAVVEVTMSRLRRKLAIAELRTVKHLGYVFDTVSERAVDRDDELVSRALR